MQPKLSVIIPAYNVEKYIPRTLESVIRQSLRPIEVIVVNDGSEDKTSEVAKEVLSNSDINWIVIDQENQGVSVARNEGLKRAKGEYVLFLDGDDYLDEKYAEIMYEKAKEYNCQIVFCKFDRVNEDGSVLRPWDKVYPKLKREQLFLGKAVLKKMLKNELWICIGNAIYNKEFLIKNDLVFFPGCSYGEDMEFIFKAIYNVEKIFFIPLTLVYYVQRTGSLTSKSAQREIFDLLATSKRLREYFQERKDIKFASATEVCILRIIVAIFSKGMMDASILWKSLLENNEISTALRKGAKGDIKTFFAYLIISFFPSNIAGGLFNIYYKVKRILRFGKSP